MSATVKCDKCGEEADDHSNNGFSRVSFHREKKGKKGEYENISIDLCWKHTQEMTDLVLEWVKK